MKTSITLTLALTLALTSYQAAATQVCVKVEGGKPVCSEKSTYQGVGKVPPQQHAKMKDDSLKCQPKGTSYRCERNGAWGWCECR